MNVVEIFNSMQGEGKYMGIMCTFVRFAGCNLRCTFCDEVKKYGRAKEMSVDEVVSQCKQPHIVLTGGEPTLQPELEKLISKLVAKGHEVHIETNGTKAIPYQTFNLWVTCSPKAPDFEINTPCDEIKLVVDNKGLTFEKAVGIAESQSQCVWLQPCDGPGIKESMHTITKWIALRPDLFRAGIQLHKYYGVI